MLDPRLFRDTEKLEEARARLSTRGFALDVEQLATWDAQRRSALQQLEDARAQKKKVSASIGQLIREGQTPEEAKASVGNQLRAFDETIESANTIVRDVEENLERYNLEIPNLPDASCPLGTDETQNVVVRTWGEKPDFPYTPKAHWDLAEELDLLDFTTGAALSGARFVVYKGLGARLERSLAQWMLNTHVDAGYTEIIPPYLVSTSTITGTGQLPKFAEDLFHVQDHDLWLIPTAEVPVTNLVRDTIVPQESLPQKYAAFTPCFRAEAGAAGRDTRGIIRQHQFHKVELVHICTPDQGYTELESLTTQAESILQKLGIHYRVIELCTGDIGFGATKTYDIEVWSPGQDRYVEISSCSLMKDFQARRMRARYKDEDGKNQPLYTLNGSGLAVGRTWIAVVENFQQEDGSINLPEVLKPFMGCDRISA